MSLSQWDLSDLKFNCLCLNSHSSSYKSYSPVTCVSVTAKCTSIPPIFNLWMLALTLSLSFSHFIPSFSNKKSRLLQYSGTCHGALGRFVNSLCSLCFGLMKTNEYLKPRWCRRRDLNNKRWNYTNHDAETTCGE